MLPRQVYIEGYLIFNTKYKAIIKENKKFELFVDDKKDQVKIGEFSFNYVFKVMF